MAMSGPTLETAIASAVYTGLAAQFADALVGLDGTGTAAIQANWQKLANSIAKCATPIVSHIVANCIVSITAFAATASGVTPGGGVSGPVAGTASGTVS